MLHKYGKLLLGAYILKRLSLGNFHEVTEVPEHKIRGMIPKYGKLVLGAYLMKRLGVGRYYGTGEHKVSTGRLLHRYGGLMLTTYAMKKLRSKKSRKGAEQPEEYMEPSTVHGSFLPHMAKKYGKWLLGMYLLKRFHHKEPEAELEEIIETETEEEGEGSSMLKLDKIIVGTIAGVIAMYAVKKYRAKCCGQKIGGE